MRQKLRLLYPLVILLGLKSLVGCAKLPPERPSDLSDLICAELGELKTFDERTDGMDEEQMFRYYSPENEMDIQTCAIYRLRAVKSLLQ